ncbi:ATP-binding protein [Janthinobacterium sp. 17J80-10]|uniref:sensor histidine kinase n=1 Tax=Janthinobacterium sp. 17J80-10 TaxID=2497863 RepID=UPI00100593B7|nr:ATP-binding protein [Janthinobacterium sp. 17J80-10]QAU34473.1 sensor histidine kinase [Janthinobacterium sp. 17J80-10]
MKLKQFIFARSLSTYLAVAFSLMSIVLTLVLVEVVERVATQQVKSNIGHSLAELALQTSGRLDRGMFERYREVRLMTQRGDLVGPGVSVDDRRKVLDGLLETYKYYAWIGMTDNSGKVQVAAHRLLEGADVSKRPWFGNALRGIHLGDVHEAVLLAKLLPNPTKEPKRFVDVAFPYNDKDGKPMGVLGVHLSWQWARDVEKSIIEPIIARRQVEALIVGADGVVLLGPPDLQGKQLAQSSFRAAQQQNLGYVVEKWPDGRAYLVGFSKGQGYQNYPGLGWTVLVRQNVDDAFLQVRQIRYRALWSGLALVLLFSTVGAIVARRITRPLDALTQSAQLIQRGDAQTIAPGAHSYFEVKTLSGALNSLVAKLLQRSQELQELNLTLENRVADRTRELEHALLAVQSNERRIATIIEAAQDAFVGVDLRGNVTDWNSRAERMFGWSRQEVIGRPLVEMVVPERFRPSFARAVGTFNETGRLDWLDRRMERIVMNRQGVEFPVEMTAGLAGTSETAFFSAFLHDISERKKVEQMKNEFVSTVSHELRTPLTSIRASLAMLADGTAGELPDDTKGLIDIAYQSCERLVRLVNDVLDIEKIESGNMQFEQVPQPLLPLVDQALEAMQGYAQQFGVALQRHVEPQSTGLIAAVDRDGMAQVLTNLISNAVKFSPRGGQVDVHLAAHDGRARLSVVDRGCGIPEAFRDRVFQKFAQADSGDSRQKGGTGLGLSICKSIVEEHGGTIAFESIAGAGTSFHVLLPLVQAAAAA